MVIVDRPELMAGQFARPFLLPVPAGKQLDETNTTLDQLKNETK